MIILDYLYNHAILDFGFRLYGGFERSKWLLWMWKTKRKKIEPDPICFMTDENFRGSVQTWLTEHEVAFIF